MTCNNELVNTNKTISDINTVISTGWFVVTAWLEKGVIQAVCLQKLWPTQVKMAGNRILIHLR